MTGSSSALSAVDARERSPAEHGRIYRGLRGLLVKNPQASPVDLAGRRILVTGASPGSLGFETAHALAAWGASVVVTARKRPEACVAALRQRLCDEAAGRRVDGYALDLSVAESVEAFARGYAEHYGEHLDVLINNAGAHLDLLSRWRKPRHSADGFELHWRTNYLGTAHLTHALLPVLKARARAKGEARIVNVASRLHTRGTNAELFEQTRRYNSWNAYGQSKLALVHMTSELERRYGEALGLHAYCLHPGSVFTNLADRGLAGTGPLQTVRGWLSYLEAFILKTAEEGAQTQIYCATQPGLRGGQYYAQCGSAAPSPEARAPAVAARLWDETRAWVHARSRASEA